MIMASRPSLQIFPPADRPPRKDSRKAPQGPPRRSLDRSKTPGDLHELIIQVPANTRSPPPQIAYMPPQPPAPVHLETARQRSPSPLESRAYEDLPLSGHAASNQGRQTPVPVYPVRTASLAARGLGATRSTTPASQRRFGVTPQTPESQDTAVTVNANSEAREWSPNSSGGPQAASPASVLSGSPTLVRTMSGRTAGRSPISPQEKKKKKEKQVEYIPMHSIFPQYDSSVPLEAQDYRPTRTVASPEIPRDQISKAPYSPPPGAQTQRSQFITPASELYRLWDASNGMIISPSAPTNISLQLNRPSASSKSNVSAKEKPQITLGSSAKEPFYSLRQSNLDPEVVADPSGQSHTLQDYELLVFRHNPSRPDILPIAHMDVAPPPPPSLSTTRSIPVASSSGFPLDVEAHAADAQHLPHHITTITPTIATLTALSASANSPAASVIAMKDPNASSPQARKLAETAVRAAEEQESVELLWRRTGPGGGAYELLHPSIGVVKMRIDGDISGKLDTATPGLNRAAKISLLNPYISESDNGEWKYGSSSSVRDDDTLASLDLEADVLDVSMPAIQKLRNPYFFDVAVCALLAVAAAESKRADDPGLKFEGPPMPKLQNKGTTKPKPQSKLKQKRRDEAGLEELPTATRGVLAILRVAGKSLLWIFTLGVKMLLAVLKGISRCFKKVT